MGKQIGADQPQRITFAPKIVSSPAAKRLVRAFAREVDRAARGSDAVTAVEVARRRCIAGRPKWDRRWRDAMVAVVDILADLARTGWSIEVGRSAIYVRRPIDETSERQRDQHRRNLISARAMQLREPSSQAFVREMERPRQASGGPCSIFSLMRDGRALAGALKNVGHEGMAILRDVVRPYLVFVDDQGLCPHTGFRLMDVWRYFRHTWANPYQSVPGRSMGFLVRDAAAPYHPVMGIGAISSAAVQMTSRDRFIGWQAESFVATATAAPTQEVAQWAVDSIDSFIGDLYLTDLVKDKWLSLPKLRRPTVELIARLEEEATRARVEHRALMSAKEYKRTPPPADDEDEHWEQQAVTPLFRSKRCEALAAILKLRLLLNTTFSDRPNATGLSNLLATSEGRAAIGAIARRAKARAVGVHIADLTVCGAIAPYNELIGGKLIAMLAASPEVVVEYKRRYGAATSVIASSMAGRAIRRSAELACLATTSLYGIRPSQYDNISVPCELLGGQVGESVRYHFLENTQGKGSFHFSDETVEAMARILRQSRNGLTVNSVFGEGANPKLRKIRDGLDCLGLPADALITHGIDKLVYVIPLARNARDFLLGLAPKPDYKFSLAEPAEATKTIADWWAERWALKRLLRPDTLDRLARHTLSLPVRHGARVVLPEADIEAPPLFDWS